MADSLWDQRLKAFLKKTGDDVRRFSKDVQDEAGKLLAEVQDPERQRQLREGLQEVGTWARRAAEEVAVVVEDGVKQAEEVLGKATERVGDFMARPVSGAQAPPAAPPPAPAPAAEPRRAAAPRPGPKSVGKAPGKRAEKRPPPAAPKGRSPAKSIGRRPRGKG